MSQQKQFDFKTLYNKQLLPELKELESERKKFIKNTTLIVVPILALSVALFFMGIIFHENSKVFTNVAYLVGLIGFVIGLGKYGIFNKSYAPRFKEKIITRMIQFIDDDLKYDPTGHISKDSFESSKIFPKSADLLTGEDLIAGTIGNTAFTFSEVNASSRTKNTKDGKKTYVSIFRGVFFEADFPKQFHGRTFVLPDVMEKRFGNFGQNFQAMNKSRPSLVKLENPDFEKHFVVYSEDQVESRYILSTTLMERLAAFREKTQHDVSLSFVDNKIFIAIHTKQNLFEPKIFSSNLEPDFILAYYNFLLLAIGIVDDLKLNRKIWGQAIAYDNSSATTTLAKEADFEKVKSDASTLSAEDIKVEDYSYEVSKKSRFIHFVLDFILFLFFAGILISAIPAPWYVSYLLALLIYYGFFEYRWQKTVSKYITNTKVVKKDRSKPGIIAILIRTLMRIIPIDPFSYLFTKNGIHDRASGTKVEKDTGTKNIFERSINSRSGNRYR